MYCSVIVQIPVEKEFSYTFDDRDSIKPGDLVLVPFGSKKEEIGLVVDVTSKINNGKNLPKIKKITKVFKNYNLKPSILEFINWVSRYTINSKGQIFKMVFCYMAEDGKN